MAWMNAAKIDKKKLLLPGLLAIAVVLRLGAALWMGDRVVELPGVADQISYHTLAQQWLAGEGFSFPQDWWPATKAGAPTAHWSFLYTFFVSGVYALFGVHPLAARLIQAAMVGVLHPWLAYLLGKKIFGERAGLAAAALSAVYIYFFYYSAALMTEPFYITAILAALYLSIRLAEKNPSGREIGLAAALGLTLAATVLLRQLFLLIIPILFLWVWWAGGWRKLLPLALSGAIVVATILPITAYNYNRFQRFVLLNTNAGYAFFWGNHPFYGARFIPILSNQIYFELIPRELLSLDEAALDQALLKRGMQFVLDDPGRYALLSLSRIPAYFTFWPSAESGLVSNLSRVGSFGVLLPVMLYGVYRAFADKTIRGGQIKTLLLLAGFMTAYTGIHLLTWALIRYRLPVDAVLLLFAGLALHVWIKPRA
ncbi:MAG: glycosyltransferase family 39 protein [Chloroflexi bacterium]|nr:glycosyltransferase family 39 protein [Chloroflexota bacterium]